MNELDDYQHSPEIHISMWKHYDSLRQAKNGAFLTANSILVAIVGFLYKQADEVIIVLVSILGILVCGSWFLLLSRNAAYIEYHRKKAGRGTKNFWTPKSWTPHSKYLDGMPGVAFFLFWIGVLVFGKIIA